MGGREAERGSRGARGSELGREGDGTPRASPPAHHRQAATWGAALAGHELGASKQQEDQKRLVLERFQAEVRGRGTARSSWVAGHWPRTFPHQPHHAVPPLDAPLPSRSTRALTFRVQSSRGATSQTPAPSCETLTSATREQPQQRQAAWLAWQRAQQGRRRSLARSRCARGRSPR